MDAVLLSASVPVLGRDGFCSDASPYLIQCAVREFLVATLGKRRIVWGGHPAITPIVWSVCEDLDVSYAHNVVLYQSRRFASDYPVENARFDNVVYCDAVGEDDVASLRKMREAMVSRPDLTAAVFIGGMSGLIEEYELFLKAHPHARIIAVPAPGGAARKVAARRGEWTPSSPEQLNFSRIFLDELSSTQQVR